jgi:hypothetical protein
MVKLKTCEDCKFFFHLKLKDSPEKGECRYNPPTIVFAGHWKDSTEQIRSIQWQSGFPNIGMKQWCGKWELVVTRSALSVVTPFRNEDGTPLEEGSF